MQLFIPLPVSPEQIAAIVQDPLVLTPDTTVLDAITQMNGIRASYSSTERDRSTELSSQARSSCVLIVEDQQLIGMLTERDIMRLIADRQDLADLPVRDVMTANPVTLKLSAFTDLAVAIDLLDRHQLRYLPVVDDTSAELGQRDRVLGILIPEILQDCLVKTLAARVDQQTSELADRETQFQNFAKNAEVVRQRAELYLGEREFLLREMTQRIRKSLQLPTIFETAVREIREFMEIDRVAIFKFQSDFNFKTGEFVAESVSDGFEPILGSKIHDPGFTQELIQYYQQGKINAVEDIYTAGLQDDEVQKLARFQVRANLVVPLLDGPTLWGLICVHHCAEQRCWQESDINFIRQIAEQIGIAIHQATLYKKVQLELEIRWRAEEAISRQLRQQQTLGSIAQQIRNSLKVEDILATATSQVKELMMVDRVTVFRLFSCRQIRAIQEVVAPEYPSLMGRDWEHEYISQEEFESYLEGHPNIVSDVQQDAWSGCLQEYIEMIGVRSKIVVPILLPYSEDQTYQVRLWGLLSVHACGDQRQWQAAESQLLQQIADQLAIAIQQASLFEQLQQELIERKQAETQLIESNQQLAVSNGELARATRLKDEFLANMSHELRTPLNAVLGMAEGLQDEIFGTINDRQRKSIFLIEKSGKHLLALINDILDLSKIEANKFNLELSDVSVQDLCKNSILFIKELAFKKQIQLNIRLPDDLQSLNLQLDDRRCRQVLINLLSNAVKFTPERGHITLDVRVAEIEGIRATPDNRTAIDQQSSAQPLRRIVFSVIDTGIGIAPENIDKLFQSFVQIDSTLNRQYAGTGLGLALVKRIVELHGGSVSVQSELDRGSCFTVSLPFCPSGGIIIPPSLPPLAAPALIADHQATPAVRQKALILVVEDNEANMETMTGYLKSRGYRTIEARNGVEAMSILNSYTKMVQTQQHPDIVLMDIQMPDLDGFEAIGLIREIPVCATLPIIALTALAMTGDRQKCLDAGANQYVTKPVKLSQLVVTIEALLN
jgi:signal transduction histidine kinase/CBS domain-containing protein/ActR/RegA family two-component response regulator